MTDLVAVVGAFTRLDPSGGHNLKGYCPFAEHGLPQFHVSRAKQLWHCFGCGRGGNVEEFLWLIRNE